MKEIEEYLQKKLDNTTLNSVKENYGATLLKVDSSGTPLEEYIGLATQRIIRVIRRSTSKSEAKLTTCASQIGTVVLEKMRGSKRDLEFKDKVLVGDLFLEAFYKTGYIEILRDSSYSEASERAPYVVTITDKWDEFPIDLLAGKKLMGTHFTLPEPVTKSVIKRQKVTNKEWEYVKDSQHIEAMNKLQSVGFKINKRVLATVEANRHLFISEEKLVIPKRGDKRSMNNAYHEMRMEKNKGKDKKLIEKLSKDYERKAKLWNKKLVALKERSKKIAFNITLKKADILKDEPVFYQTLEVDYRGRLYYDESFLNFQGKDEARSMFLFERGVVMNDIGRKYLAIHTASSYNQSYNIEEIPSYFKEDYKSHLKKEKLNSISVDKMTLEDREIWTEKNIDLILEYAKNDELRMEAEKPVAFLSTCYEWEEYLIDPDTHVTHLPIQIDGSNNGWQHLGAMSKDTATGKLVGLIPSTIQKDFYVQTAKELIQLMPDWFKKKNMPMKSIRKGISKRGSMTRAYSAGESTMSSNMYEDCYQEKYTDEYGITVKDCNTLAHNLIQAINNVCPGPLKTMKFLQKLAAYEIGTWKMFKDDVLADEEYKRIKKKHRTLLRTKNKTPEQLQDLSDLVNEKKLFEARLVEGNGKTQIEWDTPSGFHVIYKTLHQYQVDCWGTIKGIGRIHHKGKADTMIPDIRGFMSGISPNFVHSMDGSHMAITICNWYYDFAAVHDAYATHAPLVDELLYVTKEVFIQMYDKDNFFDEIIDMIISDDTHLNVEKPEIGDMKIEEVRDSEYFFA